MNENAPYSTRQLFWFKKTIAILRCHRQITSPALRINVKYADWKSITSPFKFRFITPLQIKNDNMVRPTWRHHQRQQLQQQQSQVHVHTYQITSLRGWSLGTELLVDAHKVRQGGGAGQEGGSLRTEEGLQALLKEEPRWHTFNTAHYSMRELENTWECKVIRF